MPLRSDEKTTRPLAWRKTRAGILRWMRRWIFLPVFSSFFSTLAPTPSTVKAAGGATGGGGQLESGAADEDEARGSAPLMMRAAFSISCTPSLLVGQNRSAPTCGASGRARSTPPPHLITESETEREREGRTPSAQPLTLVPRLSEMAMPLYMADSPQLFHCRFHHPCFSGGRRGSAGGFAGTRRLGGGGCDATGSMAVRGARA